MRKNRKIILGMFLALMLSLIVVSAVGAEWVCLREGETIYFSECNG